MRDVEFYTRLADEVERFLRHVRRIPVAERRKEMRKWTRNVGFFKALRRKQRDKWEKAVAEFYKAVEEQVDIP